MQNTPTHMRTRRLTNNKSQAHTGCDHRPPTAPIEGGFANRNTRCTCTPTREAGAAGVFMRAHFR